MTQEEVSKQNKCSIISFNCGAGNRVKKVITLFRNLFQLIDLACYEVTSDLFYATGQTGQPFPFTNLKLCTVHLLQIIMGNHNYSVSMNVKSSFFFLPLPPFSHTLFFFLQKRNDFFYFYCD